MEPMTLDEAKENARCYRDDPSAYCSDTERTAAALLTALEAAEQRVATVRAEAVEEAAKIADEWATAMGRAEVCAFDFATLAKEIRTLAPAPEAPPMPIVRFNPAGDVWLDHGDAPSAPPPGSTPVRSADGSTTWQRPPAPEAKAETPPANERPPANPPRHYADAAFDGAPHYDPTTPPATVRVVHRCNADNGREVCTFEADHGGAHSWPPPFDARRFAEALVEGLTAPHANVALRDDGQAVHIVREAVRRALDAGSKP